MVNHRDDVQGGDGRFDYGAVALQETFDACNRRICSTFLRNSGSSLKPNVVWDDITLQDEVENARARLYSAQAKALEKEEKTD